MFVFVDYVLWSINDNIKKFCVPWSYFIAVYIKSSLKCVK